MIRLALIALGLSAVAMSAQASQQAAPVAGPCGGAPMAEAHGGAAAPGEAGTDSAQDERSVAAMPVAEVVVPVARTAPNGGDDPFFRAMDGVERVIAANFAFAGVMPFDRPVHGEYRMDGSNPSADFCP